MKIKVDLLPGNITDPTSPHIPAVVESPYFPRRQGGKPTLVKPPAGVRRLYDLPTPRTLGQLVDTVHNALSAHGLLLSHVSVVTGVTGITVTPFGDVQVEQARAILVSLGATTIEVGDLIGLGPLQHREVSAHLWDGVRVAISALTPKEAS